MVDPLNPVSSRDLDHLRLLSIFHFVMLGFSVLGTAFIGVHYLIMHTVFDNQQIWDQLRAQQAKQNPGAPAIDPRQFMGLFIWFYVFMGGWGALSIIFNLVAGLSLRKVRSRTFCLFVAVFNCINIPLGTVLGVFTIIVLLRESVRTLYASQPAGA